MREMSSWSIAASLFFSVAIFSSGYDAMGGAVLLAGAGNPAAIERSLSAFVSRMGTGEALPNVVAAAPGRMVAVSFQKPSVSARLQREKDFVLSQGEVSTLPNDLSGQFGLTDGKTGYPIKGLRWTDDNDKSQHWCEVGTDDRQYMVFAYKPGDGAYAINWLTDVSGRLIMTVYTDNSGSRIIPNTQRSNEFTSQMAYWDGLVPPGTSVAANGSGR